MPMQNRPTVATDGDGRRPAPKRPRRRLRPTRRGALGAFVAVVVAAVLLPFGGQGAGAATAIPLGTAENFAVLGGQTVTNTGPSVVTGDIGVSPGTAITGFPPGVLRPPGPPATADVALQAQSDVTIAYNNAASQPSDGDLTGEDLGGMTLTEGVYTFSSSAQLTGTLTLQGNEDAVFIFQVGSTLTTASASTVLLSGGATACNVFWQVGSSATLGTGSDFVGTILALTSITLDTGADLMGRALARNGAVTLDTNDVDVSACAVAPPTTTVDSTSTTLDSTTTSLDATSTTVDATGTTLVASTTSAAGPATPTTDGRSPRTSRATASSVARRLPETGAQIEVTAVWAGSLVLGGALLIVLARHRIATRSDDPGA